MTRPDDEPPLTWSDVWLTGFGPLDDTHREFVEVAAALRDGPGTALPAALDAFERHAREHFGQEDRWMRETAFPAAACHIDEHAAVMATVDELRDHLRRGGDVAELRRFGAELARWFVGHAAHLDSALAHWMYARQGVGKPLVLRREVARTAPRDGMSAT